MHRFLMSAMLCDTLGAGRQVLLSHSQTAGAGLEQHYLEKLWLRVFCFLSLLVHPAPTSLSQETCSQEHVGQMLGSLGHYWGST